LTTIEWLYNGSNYCYLGSIKVDGRKLVDSGVSVPNVPSIASTVRANPSSGVSIVSYSGTGAAATVAHGLNSQPQFLIVKNRDYSNDWYCQHVATGLGSGRLRLNTTDANTPNYAASYWNSTAPTSSVVSLGTSEFVNGDGEDLIMYCFAPSETCSIGSYEGNGSNTDGPFVYTGFQPRWIIIKNVDNSGTGYDWFIFDTTRSQANVTADILKANLSAGEYSFNSIDILSNGFKIRRNTNGINLNAHTHVYMAFAEHPFKTVRAR
jgi:hypothetical protein